MIRKFFDATSVDAGGIGDVVAMMAKSGIKTDGDTGVAIPNIDTQPPAPATPAPQQPPVVETPPAPKVEPPAPAPAPVTVPPPVSAPEPIDWKKVLRQQPDTEVLKELGFDDKMLGFLHQWKTKGDVKQYLEAMTTDFSKMSAEQVMRYSLQQENPELTPQQLDRLYNIKVATPYKLNRDLFSETEVEDGKFLLDIEANKQRQLLTQKQQNLLIPAPPSVDPQAEMQREQQEAQQALTAFREEIMSNTLAKDVFANKKIAIGEGNDAFNYDIPNPEEVLSMMWDTDKWVNSTFNRQQLPDGTEKLVPNVEKQMILSLVAQDHNAFIRFLIQHGRQLGARDAIVPIENAKPPIGTPSAGDQTYSNPAQALAKMGQIVAG